MWDSQQIKSRFKLSLERDAGGEGGGGGGGPTFFSNRRLQIAVHHDHPERVMHRRRQLHFLEVFARGPELPLRYVRVEQPCERRHVWCQAVRLHLVEETRASKGETLLGVRADDEVVGGCGGRHS